ncbi:MAG TPA: PQQ-binding-like beta-propeller repeat protein [Methylomirabilota bacterium]|nr:PQQ-binding-like beta-propeller repeat protein [Methylomirabilota bacterium]
MKQSLILFAGIFCATIHAANWSQWRGPNFDGSSTETGLPAQFTKTENVAWVAPLPGPSGSTPVVFGDTVFVNSIDGTKKTRLAIALDRKTGAVRWQQEIGPGVNQDDRSNFSSPSPVTDGQVVYFYYGNGDLVCFDMDGKKIWARNIQKEYGSFAYQWTYAASPLLSDGKLYLQVLQRNVPVNGRGGSNNDSYLLALDPKTGKELWKHVRPSEAVAESLEAFSTPIPYSHNGRRELLVVGGDCITGHDPASGKELWRWGTWNPQKIGHWRLVPSPVAGAGVALACGPKNAPIYAVKLGLNGKLDDSAIAWQSTERDVTADVPTPLFYKGKFYVLNGGKRKMLCVEPSNGKVLWSGDLPVPAGSRSVFEASPTAADDKIYVMDHKGNVFVVSAATDAFKLIHTAAMGEDTDRDLRSSIPLSQGQLFIRTGSKLYCIGKK